MKETKTNQQEMIYASAAGSMLGVIVSFILFCFIGQYCWNHIAVNVFEAPPLTIYQFMGLRIMISALFGSHIKPSVKVIED